MPKKKKRRIAPLRKIDYEPEFIELLKKTAANIRTKEAKNKK